MRIRKLLLMSLLPISAWGQKVGILISGNFVDVPVQQTQAELKPGWKIVDIKLKDKITHYLWGAHASQLTEDERPTFHVIPGGKEVLSDYAIIRLQRKKTYRKLPKENLRENEYTRIEPHDFIIKSDGKDGFICSIDYPMEKGEYILLNIDQQPIGELRDLKVFPFQVQ